MHRIVFERDVEMLTRDGTVLRSDVMRPDVSDPVPAIVSRTPYDKSRNFTNGPGFFPPLVAVEAGYAVVIQDIRGRFASDGEWDFINMREVEGADGYDCVEWVSSQPWCDGRVGMFGGSYLAETQFAAAMFKPPSLHAIAPALTGMGGERMRTQGAHLESLMVAYLAFLAIGEIERRMFSGDYVDPADLGRVMRAVERPWEEAETLPIKNLLALETPGMPSFDELQDFLALATPEGGRGEDRIPVPTLWTFGWYDGTGGSEGFDAIRAQGPTAAARDGAHLILGPWTHTYQSNFVGEIGLGATGDPVAGGVQDFHARYFAKYLRGDEVVLPRVRYFLMGTNEWREASEWPVPGTAPTPMYLHSSGAANTSTGDGTLRFDAPVGDQRADVYSYDPMNPVPGWGFRVMYAGGKTLAGPFDQHRVESRADVLCYTSEVLSEPLEIVGDVDLHLFVSSSAPDTDFVAKLCDVDPNGISVNLADGFIRARYRDDWQTAKLLEPGEVVELVIRLGQTGNVFQPGHRVRLQLTSSAFPHHARNLNTSEAPELQTDPVVAVQTVFHETGRASYVVLPIHSATGETNV